MLCFQEDFFVRLKIARIHVSAFRDYVPMRVVREVDEYPYIADIERRKVALPKMVR
jgi:hypothetical protein